MMRKIPNLEPRLVPNELPRLRCLLISGDVVPLTILQACQLDLLRHLVIIAPITGAELLGLVKKMHSLRELVISAKYGWMSNSSLNNVLHSTISTLEVLRIHPHDDDDIISAAMAEPPFKLTNSLFHPFENGTAAHLQYFQISYLHMSPEDFAKCLLFYTQLKKAEYRCLIENCSDFDDFSHMLQEKLGFRADIPLGLCLRWFNVNDAGEVKERLVVSDFAERELWNNLEMREILRLEKNWFTKLDYDVRCCFSLS